MKSRFHVTASSPEDLRRELLSWLQLRAQSAEEYAQHVARTKKQQLINFTEARVYREVEKFWQEIIIDREESEKAVEETDYNA